MANTTASTARLNDDAKVDRQNWLDNNNWQRYANRLLYQTSPTANVYHIPNPDRFGVYDVTTSVNEITIYVELKERWQHYQTYMIDVAKVEALRGLVEGNKSATALLAIMEPINNMVYTFDLNRVDWTSTPTREVLVKKSTLREAEGYTEEYALKPFYFLDWSAARCGQFDDWMPETKVTISQKAVNNC